VDYLIKVIELKGFISMISYILLKIQCVSSDDFD